MSEFFRMRIHYSRGPELRYVGNLDTQLVWERTIRRSRLPIAFTQGFNARPRFHMAHALPLGFTSRHELLDMWLTEAWDGSALAERLQPACPPGLTIQMVEPVALSEPALQTRVDAAEYIALLREVPSGLELDSAVQMALESASLPRVWRKRDYDLRPLIFQLDRLPNDAEGAPRLHMLLSAREGATGRPEEVLAQMGLDPTSARVERIALVLREIEPLSDQADSVQGRQDLRQPEPVGSEDDREHQEDKDDQ